MTDAEALTFAEAIADYARDSIEQGMTLEELAGLTLREVMQDIHTSTPGSDPRAKFSAEARCLLDPQYA